MPRLNAAALALGTALLANLPARAVRSPGRRGGGSVIGQPRSPRIGDWTRARLISLFAPLVRVVVGARVAPDLSTHPSTASSVVAGLVFATGAVLAAGGLAMPGGACDVFEGRIACACSVASPYGAYLDPTLDRFAEAATGIGLTWQRSPSRAAPTLVALALGGSLLVRCARARGEALVDVGSLGIAAYRTASIARTLERAGPEGL